MESNYKIEVQKAAGPDKMTNEKLKYAPDNIQEKIYGILNIIWKGEGFPEE